MFKLSIEDKVVICGRIAFIVAGLPFESLINVFEIILLLLLGLVPVELNKLFATVLVWIELKTVGCCDVDVMAWKIWFESLIA